MPTIVKGDGTRETFEKEKLRKSLQRSGADPTLADQITEQIARTVTDGMTTTAIYKNAYALLRKEEKIVAARYSMRRAILELGPTGYPFEDFFAEMMRIRGYEALTRQIMKGKCAPHEIDVVLKKDARTIGAELKFHNMLGFKTDLKTALYVEARFRDIKTCAEVENTPCPVDEGWLVTNTKFTNAAITFAECAGIHLLGWSYPHDSNILSMIKESGVYPVTVLSSLTRKEKERLLMQGTALCRTIAKNPDVLERAGIAGRKHQNIIAESVAVCAVS
jgi:hypothetical protein